MIQSPCKVNLLKSFIILKNKHIDLVHAADSIAIYLLSISTQEYQKLGHNAMKGSLQET
jgi:hypothetical protein